MASLREQVVRHITRIAITLAFVAIVIPAGRISVASASQTECFSYAYACTPGYDATNAAGGWAWKYYGGSYAATPTGEHNCTLYAAWRLEQNGLGNPGLWGNAFEWINHTSHNNTPAIGSIAWWGSEVGGGFGHVAYVEQIRGSEVFIRADNYDESGGYTDSGWISDGSVDAFLHPHDLSGGGGGGVGEGSFVSNDGFVYRIAGGAPIYVSNWSAVGGPQPSTALSDAEFAALPQYPRDGTFLNSSTGAVYRVAGGAPLFVSNWNAVGGPQPYVTVDQAAIDNAGGGVPWSHLRPYPADGTFLNSSTGAVYRVAGGAPLFVSNWNAVGGPQQYVTVDQWDLENVSNPAAHLRAYPADGTFLNSSTGAVYRVAGGAPLFVSKWSAVGGEQPYVDIDNWDIENIGNPAAHLNVSPANGTFLNSSTGAVYRVAGGAPLFVSNWNAVGGPQPYVTVDQWDLENTSNPAAHLNSVPSDGTFLNTSTGHVYRIAGGAPFAVSSWNVFGAEQAYTTVDEWDLEHITNPAAHLNEAPANGTIVEGLPSDTYWSFTSGLRSPIAAISGATTVDDVGLAAYPQLPSGAGTMTQPATGLSSPTPSSPSQRTTPSQGVLGTRAHAAPKNKTSRLSLALQKCRRIKSSRRRAICEVTAKRRYGVARKRRRGVAKSSARTAPAAQCKGSLLFNAAEAHEDFNTTHGYSHISPPGAREAICDTGWAVAAISRPNVGTTDGYTLFRSEEAQWREVGQLGGSVATCQLKQYHVPSRVALVLAHGHVHSGVAGC